MTNGELIELVARAVLKEFTHLNLDSIDNRDQTQPIQWSIAQAVIDHLTPIMRDVVGEGITKAIISLKSLHSGQPSQVFIRTRAEDILQEALASLPECWKGGV